MHGTRSLGHSVAGHSVAASSNIAFIAGIRIHVNCSLNLCVNRHFCQISLHRYKPRTQRLFPFQSRIDIWWGRSILPVFTPAYEINEIRYSLELSGLSFMVQAGNIKF